MGHGKKVGQDPSENKNYGDYYKSDSSEKGTKNFDAAKQRVNNLVDDNIRSKFNDSEQPRSYVNIKLGGQGGYDLNNPPYSKSEGAKKQWDEFVKSSNEKSEAQQAAREQQAFDEQRAKYTREKQVLEEAQKARAAKEKAQQAKATNSNNTNTPPNTDPTGTSERGGQEKNTQDGKKAEQDPTGNKTNGGQYRGDYSEKGNRNFDDIKSRVNKLIDDNIQGSEPPNSFVEFHIDGQEGCDLAYSDLKAAQKEYNEFKKTLRKDQGQKNQEDHKPNEQAQQSADNSTNSNNTNTPPNTDPTGTSKRNQQEKKAQDAKKEWDEKKSNPNTPPEETQKKKKEFDKARETFLEQDNKDNAQAGYTKQAVDKLNDVADSCRGNIQKSQEQIAKGQKHQQKADNLQKSIEKIEKQLGNEKIKIKDKNGVKQKVSTEEGKKFAEQLKGKLERQKIKADKIGIRGLKLNQACNGAIGSMANEAANQVKDAGSNLGAATALAAVDNLSDYLEGKCDLATAAWKTGANAATGTLSYAGTSIAYEGLKGAITATVTNGADKIPALGTIMKVTQAASLIYYAENATDVKNQLCNFLVEAGPELAMVGAVTLATGGASVPIQIGAKVLNRGGRMFYNWWTTPV